LKRQVSQTYSVFALIPTCFTVEAFLQRGAAIQRQKKEKHVRVHLSKNLDYYKLNAFLQIVARMGLQSRSTAEECRLTSCHSREVYAIIAGQIFTGCAFVPKAIIPVKFFRSASVICDILTLSEKN
jgi:hypothetical protein